jgi:hypothetical protein
MRIISLIFLILFFPETKAQVFWTENFNTGVGWTLANVTGVEGADPNFFQITANEGGNITPNMGAPTSCGVANNGNNTMHVTSVFFPGGGAAYDAGGLCGFLFCPQTNRRAQSPVINCSGQVGITLSFEYIEKGQTTLDNGTCWYFDGVSWAQIDDMPKTALGCGGQGIWTNRSIALPASADNNPNVRVGFKWVNNDDGVGTDPSLAVDNLSLSVASLPIELISFTAESANEGIRLNWELMNEGGMKGYAIERSENAIAFDQIAFVNENSQVKAREDFVFVDAEAERGINYYYRLKSVEKDGSFKNSSIVSAKLLPGVRDIKILYSEGNIAVENSKDLEGLTELEVLDVQGKVMLKKDIDPALAQNKIDVSQLQAGIYFCKISNALESVTVKLPIW